uniref:MSP domain-containing protein n=1 Tax=Strongyloides papillosus TaxID=174720 RepID=A0A0N5CFJ3_STREA
MVITAGEALRLATYNKKSTISSRKIKYSVKFILPDELTRQAISERGKALTKLVTPR